MAFTIKRNAWKSEWNAFVRKEDRFLTKQKNSNPPFLNEKLEKIVPSKLRETLDAAFYKAFQLVFEKGNKMINMTYAKEKREADYKINSYAVDIQTNRKNVSAFTRQALTANKKNLLLSGIEGAGLGALGLGLPDIPLFTAMILKSIYEIAISYGYLYDTGEERMLILHIIDTALCRGDELITKDGHINRYLEHKMPFRTELKEQQRRTADTLSKELLYMKFLQGIPIAGIVGGLSDTVYLKKITDYASLKYKRRFLLDKCRKPS